IRDDAQTLGVEIRQREATNFALALQIGEVPERVEVAPVAVIPPVELKEIEAVDAHSRERDRDRILDDPPCHAARMWNPFCACLSFTKPLGAVTGGELAAKGTDEVLRGAVMI